MKTTTTPRLRLVPGLQPLPGELDAPAPELTPALLREALAVLGEEQLAEALAALGPSKLGRVVDKTLVRVVIARDAGAHLEHAVLVGLAVGELCDKLAGVRPAPSPRRDAHRSPR